MKNTNKKGFTLVELVIVIAVIAILAAVLIPTFTSVINRANQSATLQKIKAVADEAYVEYVAENHAVPTHVTVYTITTDAKTEFVSLVFGVGVDNVTGATRTIYVLPTTGDPDVAVLDSRYGLVCFSWTVGQGFSITTAKTQPVETFATTTVS